MRAVSRSRSAVLPAMSKRVPELGQTGAQIVGAPTQIGVHSRAPERTRGRVVRDPPHELESRIAKKVRRREPRCVPPCPALETRDTLKPESAKEETMATRRKPKKKPAKLLAKKREPRTEDDVLADEL